MKSMKRAAKICTLATALGLSACGMHANPAAPTPQSAPRLMQPMDVIGGPGTKLQVLLGDAAPNLGGRKLQRLDVGIKEVDAIENGQTTVLASFDEPHVVNVLAHQDDNSGDLVASANVARADYQQLRLVVDLASSSAKLTGAPAMPIDFLVNVASASSVGAGSTTVTTTDGPGAVDLVVTQPFSIPEDHQHSVRVDFNAFESLTLDAAGNLLSRASLFVAPVDDISRITGRILNSSGEPVTNATVVAVASDGSIGNTSFTNGKGHFNIGTLRAGTYQLTIYNDYTTASGLVITASGESAANASVKSFAGPSVTTASGGPTSAGTIKD